MKKVFTVFVLLLGSGILKAEQMNFVTTLSSPLGTFAQLETADPGALTSVPLVNFCNSRSAVGTVSVKGADVYLQTLNLKSGTTLGGNTGEFRIASALSVNNNTTVTGGRLMANAASLSGASSAKSKVEDTLHMSTMKVKGAKTGSLTIPSQVQSRGTGNDDELEWSNVYGKDYNKDGEATGSKSYTSYLLKTKVRCIASEAAGCTSSKGTWDDTDCSCKCPSNMVLKNKKCIGKFTPKVIDIGVLVNCHYTPDSGGGHRKWRKQCSEPDADPHNCYNTGWPNYPANVICWGGARCCVHTYEFYEGGSLVKSPKDTGKFWVDERWLFWEGGTHIGGQLNGSYFSGGSMPACSGDHQSVCDSQCKSGSSSCTYKCLVSKNVPGCVNGTYRYSSGSSCNNASGTGKVLTCVSQ